jgi:hypothetical protein
VSGTLHEDPSTCLLLTAVQNILYLYDKAKGTRCYDSVATINGLLLLLPTNGTRYFVSMTRMAARTRRNITLNVLCLSCFLYWRPECIGYSFFTSVGSVLKMYQEFVYNWSWTFVWEIMYITNSCILFSISSRVPRKTFWNQWFHPVHLKLFKSASDRSGPN